MKHLILIIGFVVAVYLVSISLTNPDNNAFIRQRVLLIVDSNRMCTAIEVKVPSGKIYTLSAAHCRDPLSGNPYVIATSEEGTEKHLNIIEIDRAHDLMLLEAFDNRSIVVAEASHIHDHVHAMTRGLGLPTFRTDGEVLNTDSMLIGGGIITTPEEMQDCGTLPSGTILLRADGFYCQVRLTLEVTTAQVLPGSSGGPALNDTNELIGIVDGSDGLFSLLVPLPDIQAFLKDR